MDQYDERELDVWDCLRFEFSAGIADYNLLCASSLDAPRTLPTGATHARERHDLITIR
jgi:hypothetical protein